MNQLERLRTLVTQTRRSAEEIEALLERIHRETLGASERLCTPNFTRIRADDLEALFDRYDQAFFDGQVGRTARRATLSFRLSSRMTSKAGQTAMRRLRGSKAAEYEIAVSSTLLFQAFAEASREITVAGLPCHDRLQALQRVMEHELVHLLELWLWDDSSCTRPRYQDIARRIFGHTDHTHRLITPRERASETYGIRAGIRVAFMFEGTRYEGVVNRVTKRATVLVEDPRGERYSNKKRYLKFYVPVSALERLPDGDLNDPT